MEQGNHYIIEGGAEGKKRLQVLAGLLHASTRRLIESVGPIAGKRFLDVGSGGGDVSIMVSGMVGPQGHVTALDFDPEIIELCQEDARRLQLGNITYRTLDAHALDDAEAFDVAYARFLLSHLQRPEDVLHRMAASLVRGGRILIEDIDFSGHFCHPASEAFDTYVRLFVSAARNNGQDPNIGLRLFRLLGEEPMLEDVQVEVIQPCFAEGQGKWMAWLTMSRIREAVLKQGLADDAAIDGILSDLQRFTEDGSTVISLPRIFRVSARRK